MPKYKPELDKQGNPTGRFIRVKEDVVEREDLKQRKTELDALIDTCDMELANVPAIQARRDELIAERDEIDAKLA